MSLVQLTHLGSPACAHAREILAPTLNDLTAEIVGAALLLRCPAFACVEDDRPQLLEAHPRLPVADRRRLLLAETNRDSRLHGLHILDLPIELRAGLGALARSPADPPAIEGIEGARQRPAAAIEHVARLGKSFELVTSAAAGDSQQ